MSSILIPRLYISWPEQKPGRCADTGPTSEQTNIENNITAMAELAHVHHIRSSARVYSAGRPFLGIRR